ncbi:MAG: DUF4131 domain-containing protein, partial [Chloroflexi bacterium]
MPLLWLSLAFLAGVAASSLLHIESQFWLLGSGIASLALLIRMLLNRRFAFTGTRCFLPANFPQPPIPYPLLFLLFFLGAFRFQSSQPSDAHNIISEYAKPEVEVVITGKVLLPPVHHDRTTSLIIYVNQLRLPDGSLVDGVDGHVQATLPAGSSWRYGDLLRLEGVLELPEDGEDFSYRDYLAGQGIYAQMIYPWVSLTAGGKGNPVLLWIYALRERSVETLYRLYPDPEASLLAGILLGVESGIPEKVMDAFRDTG